MATSLVGGALLSASLQVLFDRLASRDFINLFRGRKHEERLLLRLQNLKMMLWGVKPLLEDAEMKQFTNTEIKDWVDDLKDTIYHADDLLDEIATKAMQSKLDSEFPTTTTATNFIGSWSTFGEEDDNIASRIEEIIQKLEYFVNAKDYLGLGLMREIVVDGRKARNISSHSHRLPTTSLEDHVSVYGRNDDKDKICQLLISDDSVDDSNGPPRPQFSVIPIVGMGGIGKTTLAKLVYNDPGVIQHFERKIWICVSEEFDILKVTKSILEELKLPTSGDNLNTLQVELRNRLAGKKFFIVLDDVWNENENNWVQLSLPFRVGKHGSKIIVTTRHKEVASIMLHNPIAPIFHLGQLSDEDCWLLFSNHSFGTDSPICLPDRERIRKKIVEKCKGLPLAARTLSGLLRHKLKIEEWESVLESHFWDLPKGKTDILPALLLSYHHLPSHLKLCFAFCAIIPKDQEFRKDELVPLWIAAGFVQQPRTGGRIEEIGDGYFWELISRSLFQQSSDNYFSMHDLINDLAQFVAGEYCFRLEDDHPHDISKIRYLSYFKEGFNAFAKSKASNEAIYIRVLKQWRYYDARFTTMVSHDVLHDVLSRLRCLRALSLTGSIIVELPDSIGKLIHLRYLDLSGTAIEILPDTICRLCNLETFLLRDCTKLTSLPTLLCKLICLRHLDLRGTKLTHMPIGKLRSLQQLPNFIVGNQIGSTTSELRELHYLRGALSISNLQNVLTGRDASEANLKNKEHLEELNLEWVAGETNGSQKEFEVLEKLQPHENLKHLTIKNYGGTRFPAWFGNRLFSKLKSLYLCNCTNCFELPPLGKLPYLQELIIEGMNMVMKVGSEFYGYDSSEIKPFQSLEKLRFEKMPEWEEWSMLGAGEFCHLLELCIRNCPKLKGEFSVHFPCLKKLEIYRCQRLVIENMEPVTDPATGVVAGQHLSSLQELRVSNISELQCLPLELCRLTNLKVLVISRCPMLHTVQILPLELCWLTNLEELKIFDCPMLNTIQIIGGDHQSVSSQSDEEMKRVKTKFRSLVICRCPELELPLSEDAEHYYKFLQDLKITGGIGDSDTEMFFQDLKIRQRSCDSLKSFPLGFFPKLRSLEIDGCKNFESFSVIEGIQNLTSLQSLRISNCRKMVYFSKGGLPARNLIEIRIESCKKLKALPEQMSTLLPSLRSLDLINLPKLELLLYDDSEHQYKFLQNLKIVGSCDSLKYFPLGFFPNLCNLEIKNCKNLESLSGLDGQQNLTSLKCLLISDCPNMVSFVDGGGLPAPNLTSITIISCTRLKALPEQMCTLLSSLQSLYLQFLPEIESFPSGGLPDSLSELTISFCDKLMACRTEWGLQRLPSLRMCTFRSGYKREEDKLWESFPEECLLPTSLTDLTIENCPNLKSLNHNGLRHLNCLEELRIHNCPKLQSLPDEGLPSSLLTLFISDCPLLEERCQEEIGEDWLKISHIPNISIQQW